MFLIGLQQTAAAGLFSKLSIGYFSFIYYYYKFVFLFDDLHNGLSFIFIRQGRIITRKLPIYV